MTYGKRNNNFIEQLRARQEAARSKPAAGEKLADIVSKLTPPPASVESNETPRGITTVIGFAGTGMAAGAPTGTVPQVLDYLAGLARKYEEPVKPDRDAAA